MSEKVFLSAKELKVGKYVLVDEVPCRVVSSEHSKTGKHGSGKVRVTAIGIFEGQKKVFLAPGDGEVEVPIIDRNTVQIMAVNGNNAQVMDSKTYEVYDIEIPPELISEAAAGKEADVLEAMGKRKIERIR